MLACASRSNPTVTDALHIAYVTPEMVPFMKTGGLADVSAALPKALVRFGPPAHRRHAPVRVDPVPPRRVRGRGPRLRRRRPAQRRLLPPAHRRRSRGRLRRAHSLLRPPPAVRRRRRQPALRLSGSGRTRVLPQPRRASQRLPQPRLAERPRARLPEGLVLGRSDATPDPECLHHSQRRLSGPVRAGHPRCPGPARPPRSALRPGVRRSDQLPEGWHRLRRGGEHGLAHVRAGDSRQRARLRLRGDRAFAGGRCGRHPERSGLRRVGPGDGRPRSYVATRSTTSPARPSASPTCSAFSGFRSRRICRWSGSRPVWCRQKGFDLVAGGLVGPRTAPPPDGHSGYRRGLHPGRARRAGAPCAGPLRRTLCLRRRPRAPDHGRVRHLPHAVRGPSRVASPSCTP